MLGSSEISDIFTNLPVNYELDVMFNNYRENNKLNVRTFMEVLRYLKTLGKNMVEKTTMDCNYSPGVGINFRVSVEGLDEINFYKTSFGNRRNHIIFFLLMQKYNLGYKNLNIIRKSRVRDMLYDDDSHDIRYRVSSETKVTTEEMDNLKNIRYTEAQHVIFRYKQRVSVVLIDNSDINVTIDCTIVKSSKNINTLESEIPIYEVEIDITRKTGASIESYYNKVMDTIVRLKKVMQSSTTVITNEEKKQVFEEYLKSMGIKNKNVYRMNSVSLERQHLVNFLPNQYSVTDKADGERRFLYIFDTQVYFISTNKEITKLPITVSDKKYNHTCLDGELLFFPNENKFVFLAFDILLMGGEDMRSISSLKERIGNLNQVINKIFHNPHTFTQYKESYDREKVESFHRSNIKKYFDNLGKQLKDGSKPIIVLDKYFIFPFSVMNNEIFHYSKIMWEMYTDPTLNPYYQLDGLTYTGITQPYESSIEKTKFKIYKWKPENKNSIDFYITFQKNELGEILTFFDKTKDGIDGDYLICKLHVGKNDGGVEKPTLFHEKGEGYEVFLSSSNGVARDMEGGIIQDMTVVEFYYNHLETNPRLRWVPMRTRFDKTESVEKYGRNYGNFESIAEQVWRSIQNPITLQDLFSLSGDEYDEKMKTIKDSLQGQVLESSRTMNAYYQKITKLGENFRKWHQFVKSHVIYTYCMARKTKKMHRMSVLELGFGRGGDIEKYWHSRIKFAVCLDLDPHSLKYATDSAISRYNDKKKKNTGVPPMHIAVADVNYGLDAETQKINNPNITKEDEAILTKYLGKGPKAKNMRFDVISSQMAIHYQFKSPESFENLCNNINRYLVDGGYVLITTLDGEKVRDSIGDEERYTEYYTTEEGEKKVLYDIVKKYPKCNHYKTTGIAIDFYGSWMFQEGNYVTEYLVDKEFIIEKFKENCNLTCVDTELFQNLYTMRYDFFKEYSQYEAIAKNKRPLETWKKYFDDDTEFSNKLKKYSNLHRFYVFQKLEIVE